MSMPDDKPDTQLTNNPEAEAVFAYISRAHRTLIELHTQLTNRLDAHGCALASVSADVECHPHHPGLVKFDLAFLDRMRPQIEAAGLVRQ
jgi:hypothetical protein